MGKVQSMVSTAGQSFPGQMLENKSFLEIILEQGRSFKNIFSFFFLLDCNTGNKVFTGLIICV